MISHKLVETAPDQQSQAEHVVGPGEFGIDPEGVLVLLDRLGQLAHSRQAVAEVVTGRGQLGIDPHGLTKLVDRVVQPSLGLPGDA